MANQAGGWFTRRNAPNNRQQTETKSEVKEPHAARVSCAETRANSKEQGSGGALPTERVDRPSSIGDGGSRAPANRAWISTKHRKLNPGLSLHPHVLTRDQPTAGFRRSRSQLNPTRRNGTIASSLSSKWRASEDHRTGVITTKNRGRTMQHLQLIHTQKNEKRS